MILDANVEDWFNGKFRIVNETDILLPTFETKRPDRVMVKENEAIIVDYKFGIKKYDEHIKQVQEYVFLLLQMGFAKVNGFVWYMNLGEMEKVGGGG